MKKNIHPEFDIAYSIGAACGTSFHLKSMCMRLTSGPFDWIPSNFSESTNDILAEFKDFMNEEDFVFTEDYAPREKQVEHSHYRNLRDNRIYIHDFPAGVPLRESFPLVKARYARRIERMKLNFVSSNVLLVYFSLTTQTDDNVIIEQSRKICEKYNRKIHFLVIEHDPELPRKEIRHKAIAENVDKYTLYAKLDSGKDADAIRGDEKTIQGILAKYPVAGSASRRRRMLIKRFIIKMLACSIPVSSVRRRFRTYLKERM